MQHGSMKIAITSQNFRTITGHAGKTRRFLLYEIENGQPRALERWDLPKEMSLHAYRGEDHPLFQLDGLITGGCGAGFIQRMARHGVRVWVTTETDPQKAVAILAAGEELPAPSPKAADSPLPNPSE